MLAEIAAGRPGGFPAANEIRDLYCTVRDILLLGTADEGDTSCLCFELRAVNDSLAIRVATVPVLVPFSVQSKIYNNFKVLQFLKVLLTVQNFLFDRPNFKEHMIIVLFYHSYLFWYKMQEKYIIS